MAGDLGTVERVVVNESGMAASAVDGTQVVHRYGRVQITAESGAAADVGPPVEAGGGSYQAGDVPESVLEDLDELERLGLAALRLRESEGYLNAKRYRPRDGEPWNIPGCTTVVPTPEAPATEGLAPAQPTSAYLEGSVAVGIIIVEGPTDDLKFSADERTTVVAEVQNGLSWYATTNPLAGLSFTYDIHTVTLTVQADPNAADKEALWRDPAMGALGYSQDWNGVTAYVENIRNTFGTRWTYCGFFTKYPLDWFAYASIGGPRLVMQYANDGWGPDNIDRVFAHESGHIFGCPDEYASSNCDCSGRWGRFQTNNGNCENCAPGGGVACLMKANTFSLCAYTPGHLGWWVETPLFANHSGKVLDVSGISTADGAPVIQWEWWGGDNQRWRLEAVGEGYVRAVAKHSGKVLDVSGISTADGAPVIQWTWWGGDNQRWSVQPVGDDYYRLVAKHSGKVLDVTGASTANGAQVIQWPWNGGGNQRWAHQFTPLVAKHSGKVLDVSGVSTANGAQVIQWPWWGGGNQRWRLEAVGDGYYRLVAKHSGKVLDVSGISTDNGAPVIQWDWWGGDNQRWRLVPPA
jgi:hypothetical protein